MTAPTIGDFIYYGLVQVSEAKIIQELENQYLVEYADNTVTYWKKDGICKTKIECFDILINLLVKQKELETADASASSVIEGSVVASEPEQIIDVPVIAEEALLLDAIEVADVIEASVVAEVTNEV